MANTVQIKYKNLDMIKERAKKAINAALDRQLLDDIGSQIVEMNQKLIRSGENPYSKSSQYDRTKFNPLSDSWKKRRKELAKFNQTGLGYGPNKSNVTFTGQLVNSIFYRSNSISKIIYIALRDSKRQPYLGVKGKPLGKQGLTNNQLGKYMAKKGLIFLGLTVQMKQRAKEMLERKLRKLLRRV